MNRTTSNILIHHEVRLLSRSHKHENHVLKLTEMERRDPDSTSFDACITSAALGSELRERVCACVCSWLQGEL